MLSVGQPVVSADAPEQPERRAYEGRFVLLAPVDPAHDAAELYPLSHGNDDVEALRTYMPCSPFAGQADMRAWMADIKPGTDPLFLTVRHADTGAALGMVSFLSIAGPNRCLELGHIWYVPAAQLAHARPEIERRGGFGGAVLARDADQGAGTGVWVGHAPTYTRGARACKTQTNVLTP